MKFKITARLLLLAVMAGCNSTSQGDKGMIDSVAAEPAAKVPGEKSKLYSLSVALDGYWLSDPYLANIEKTRTIFGSRDYTTSLFGFTLDKDNLAGDEPYLNGFTDHEGGYGSPLRYNAEKNTFENATDRAGEYAFFKIPFNIRLTDGDHLEIRFSQSPETEQYRKVEDADTELRSILFEGKYRDNVTTNEIEFTREGQVTGIPGKRFYQLLYDFGEGLTFDVVLISSDKRGDDQDIFHYEINDDTIRLFQVTGEVPEYSIGAMAYELIKL